MPGNAGICLLCLGAGCASICYFADRADASVLYAPGVSSLDEPRRSQEDGSDGATAFNATESCKYSRGTMACAAKSLFSSRLYSFCLVRDCFVEHAPFATGVVWRDLFRQVCSRIRLGSVRSSLGRHVDGTHLKKSKSRFLSNYAIRTRRAPCILPANTFEPGSSTSN